MKIEFDDIAINVPSSWKDVKLKDYERWYHLQPKDDRELVEYVAAVCNTNTTVLMDSPAKIFNMIVDTISFIYKDQPDPNNEILIGGEKYHIAFDKDLILREWADVETVLSGDFENKLTKLLAILCRPKGAKYDDQYMDKMEEVEAMFAEITCDKILPLTAFFLLRKQRFDQLTSQYLKAVETASRFQQGIETFVATGVGTKSLPIWQKVKYWILKKYLTRKLSRFSRTFSTISQNHKLKSNN